MKNTFESTEEVSGFLSYRKSRINYYGVLGLQARAHLWIGDKEGALKYAREIKNAKNVDGISKFRLTNEEDDFPLKENGLHSWVDGTSYCEHICGLNCDNYDYSKGGWQDGRPSLYNKKTDFEEKMFGKNKNDLRYKYLWRSERTSTMTAGYVCRKYRGFYVSSKSMKNFPIVRLSEIYFIIMECAALSEANLAYKEFCEARGMDYIPLQTEDRQMRIMTEYLRELAGEGQNFFTYKRFNVRRMWFSDTDCSEEQYRLPIPEKEYVEE